MSDVPKLTGTQRLARYQQNWLDNFLAASWSTRQNKIGHQMAQLMNERGVSPDSIFTVVHAFFDVFRPEDYSE